MTEQEFVYEYELAKNRFDEWQQMQDEAEAACKTYKIESCGKNCICMPNQDEPFSCEIIGSIHEAELLESGMIKMVVGQFEF